MDWRRARAAGLRLFLQIEHLIEVRKPIPLLAYGHPPLIESRTGSVGRWVLARVERPAPVMAKRLAAAWAFLAHGLTAALFGFGLGF